MAVTGQRYTEALQALLENDSPPDSRKQSRRWVDQLGSPQHNAGAFDLLKSLPADELRAAAVQGLHHRDPNVRRRCCRLLDDVTLTPESIAALTEALGDHDPTVRAAALHSLTCAHCKPDGCALDERALFERGVCDSSAVVRSAVVGPMTWRYDLVQPWVVVLLEQVVKHDTNRKVCASAAKALERIRDQLARDASWRKLPEPLRSTVGRHVGKWVIVSEGRVISAHPSRGQTAKQARGARHTRRTDPGTGLEGADLYWVAPTSEAVPTDVG